MTSLFLAWQARNRSWYPVGRLDADVAAHRFHFGYTKGALLAGSKEGFAALPSFPDMNQSYESSELFPLFKNRVLTSTRHDFSSYLATLDMSEPDPIAMLALTGGERQTDSLEVFPKIDKRPDGSFMARFFVHGMRYMTPEARVRALQLKSGEALGVSVELNNPSTQYGIQLTTRDYHFVGWTPHYLVADLLMAVSSKPQVSARVILVNQEDVPVNRRILVEFRGTLPKGVEPMSGEHFQLIAAESRR
jgi:hypothetical protein